MHITQDLEYVALDPQKQKIPLVEIHSADGKVKTTYFDAAAGISSADAQRLPPHESTAVRRFVARTTRAGPMRMGVAKITLEVNKGSAKIR